MPSAWIRILRRWHHFSSGALPPKPSFCTLLCSCTMLGARFYHSPEGMTRDSKISNQSPVGMRNDVPCNDGRGQLFVCSPSHICKRCNEGETEEKGIVIPCRRCPVSYHVNCLPKKILNSPVTRVWISKKDIEGACLGPSCGSSAQSVPSLFFDQDLDSLLLIERFRVHMW